MNRAVVCFGSNVEPQHNVERALELLGELFGVLARSDTEWTRPIGRTDQPDFLNGAVLIETPLGRDELVRQLHTIEGRLGRVRNPHDPYGPRTIDLDVVAWNGCIVHEDYHGRDFVRRAVDELLGGDLKDT